MKLNPEPFAKISSGRKTIELRLYDEKRRKIKTGDTIIFTNTADHGEKIGARVTALHIFADFAELYRELPLTACGYTEENVSSASPSDMEKYYPPEEQEKYGAVGIQIELIR